MPYPIDTSLVLNATPDEVNEFNKRLEMTGKVYRRLGLISEIILEKLPKDASGTCAAFAIGYLFGTESIPKNPLSLKKPQEFSELFFGKIRQIVAENTMKVIIPENPDELLAITRNDRFIGGTSIEHGHVRLILPGIGLRTNEPMPSLQALLGLVHTDNDFDKASAIPPKEIFEASIDSAAGRIIYLLSSPAD